MRLSLSPTQQIHFDRTRQLLSLLENPNTFDSTAAREAAEVGLLQHALKGYRDIKDPGVYPEGNPNAGLSKDRYYYKDESKGYKDRPLDLEKTDIEGLLTEDEIRDIEILEVQNALNGIEEIDKFKSLTEGQRALLVALYRKHISGTSRGKIGVMGATGRVYPQDHPTLAGQPIPFSMTKDELAARSDKLFLDQASGVDPDTAQGLYGMETHAMHRKPAAEYPELIADKDNIKQGLASLNMSDGKREGQALIDGRQKRLLRLQGERFVAENETPYKQRGGIDKQTLTDGRIAAAMSKDELQAELAQRLLQQRIDEIAPMIASKREDSAGDNQERALVINSGGGDVNLGDNVLRKNGKNGDGH